jgi:uncharacterized protein DUF4386
MTYINDLPPRTVARLAGFFYLIYIVTFAFSSVIQGRPIVPGDAAATARNILASETLFRVGFMTELLAAAFFLLGAWALYVLLKPVNKNIALLFVLFNVAGVAVEAVNTLIHFTALLSLNGSDYLKVFTTDQVHALAMLFLSVNSAGNIVSGLYYGIWVFPLGYLVLKSGFLPKVLGALLLVDGVSLLICFFQLCLFPGYQKLTYPLYPVMFIAEFGLALWLLIKGVKDQRSAVIGAGQGG